MVFEKNKVDKYNSFSFDENNLTQKIMIVKRHENFYNWTKKFCKF